MPVIDFDVSDSDPEAAVSGTFESPKPGIYNAKVKSITPGFSKTDGKEDKTRPRIEVVFQISEDGPYKGSQLWYYLTFGAAAKWKYDQFLQVFGIATATKRQGKWDTNKVVGKSCRLRIRAGKDLDDNYRGEVAAVLKLSNAATGGGGDGDDENIFAPASDGGEEPEETTPEPDPAEENSSDEDGFGSDDDDDMIDDIEEDTSEPLTIDDLKAMTPQDLGALAKNDFGISVKGKKKSEVIDEIMQEAARRAANEQTGDDDEEMPF